MPSRNVLKIDIPDSYYHIYSRGASRQPVFLDESDYEYFLTLLRRYLSEEDFRSKAGLSYIKLRDNIELLAYCLMQNHFHLLVYQVDEKSMQRLMRGVITAYSIYFNKKYGRSGALFESRYKASRIDSDEYLLHISRYIHLNPDKWLYYPYSSIKYYLTDDAEDWINPKRILEQFSSISEYSSFLADYKDTHNELEDIKHQLAGY